MRARTPLVLLTPSAAFSADLSLRKSGDRGLAQEAGRDPHVTPLKQMGSLPSAGIDQQGVPGMNFIHELAAQDRLLPGRILSCF